MDGSRSLAQSNRHWAAWAAEPTASLHRAELWGNGETTTRTLGLNAHAARTIVLPAWLRHADTLLTAVADAPRVDEELATHFGAPDRDAFASTLALLEAHGLLYRNDDPSQSSDIEEHRAAFACRQHSTQPRVVDLRTGAGGSAPTLTGGPAVALLDRGSDLDGLALIQHHGGLVEAWCVLPKQAAPEPAWLQRLDHFGVRLLWSTKPTEHAPLPRELARLASNGTEVIALCRLAADELLALDADATAQWLGQHHLGGLRLELADAGATPQDIAAALSRLHAAVPECSVVGLPRPATLVGLLPADRRLRQIGASAQPPAPQGPSWWATVERLHMLDRARALWTTQHQCQAPQTRRADEALLDPSYFATVAELLALRPDSRMVDLGGATGRFARGLGARLSARGAAIDVDLDPIAIARGRLAAAAHGQRRARFRCASCTPLPFADDCLDAALLYGFTAPLTDELSKTTALALAEARRVVRPGGRVVFGYPLMSAFVSDDEIASACGLGGTLDGRVLTRLFGLLTELGLEVLTTVTPGGRILSRAEIDTVLSDLCLDYLPAVERPVHPWTAWLRDLPESFERGMATDLFVATRVPDLHLDLQGAKTQ